MASVMLPWENDAPCYGRVFVKGKGGVQSRADGALVMATPKASIPLSSLPDGVNPTKIKLKETGTDIAFLVLKHNYESSGRTLVLRNELCNNMGIWGNNSGFSGSTIDTWMNNTYFATLESIVQNLIQAVEIPYTPGNGNYVQGKISRKIFPLSAAEMDLYHSQVSIEGTPLSYFNSNAKRIAYRNGTETIYWTRTPESDKNNPIIAVVNGGAFGWSRTDSAFAYRPAFTLPADMLFSVEPDASGYYTPV